jgi:hypothetical protein
MQSKLGTNKKLHANFSQNCFRASRKKIIHFLKT